MSVKIHFLSSHLVRYVRENPLSEFSSGFICGGSVSDEHGEGLHSDIAAKEGRYKGTWCPSMLADYCWNLMRGSPNSTFNRQAKKDRMH